jgi:hypothetical protein
VGAVLHLAALHRRPGHRRLQQAEHPRADPGTAIGETPGWFNTWSNVGLITVDDLNSDGIIDYSPLASGTNELTINNDIIVLATPEIAGLPAPVVGLVAAGALAAALSTASGLLLVISSAVANDIYYKRINNQATEAKQLMVGRIAMAAAILVAGYLGINPPGFVAQVVALAFGLAAGQLLPDTRARDLLEEVHGHGRDGRHHRRPGTTMAYMLWTIDIYGNSAGLFNIPEAGFGTIGHADQLRGHDRGLAVHAEAQPGDAGPGRGHPLPGQDRAGRGAPRRPARRRGGGPVRPRGRRDRRDRRDQQSSRRIATDERPGEDRL